jgi:hypothetical protein
MVLALGAAALGNPKLNFKNFLLKDIFMNPGSLNKQVIMHCRCFRA